MKFGKASTGRMFRKFIKSTLSLETGGRVSNFAFKKLREINRDDILINKIIQFINQYIYII